MKTNITATGSGNIAGSVGGNAMTVSGSNNIVGLQTFDVQVVNYNINISNTSTLLSLLGIHPEGLEVLKKIIKREQKKLANRKQK